MCRIVIFTFMLSLLFLQASFIAQKAPDDEIAIHVCLEEIKIFLGQTETSCKAFIAMATSASQFENSKDSAAKHLMKTIKGFNSEFKDFEVALMAKKKSLETALCIVKVQQLLMELRGWVAEKNELRKIKVTSEDLCQLLRLETRLAVSDQCQS